MANLAPTGLPPELLRTIDPVCDTFEQLWKADRRPLIEDYLGKVAEAVRPALLIELLRTELEWRFRHGEQPTAAEYGSRFPGQAASFDEWLGEARSAAETMGGRKAGTETDDADTPCARTLDTGVGLPAPGPQPRVMGEYELLERLGAGGMGEVYKARHRKLHKLVALKLLLAGPHRSEQAVTRFLREMKAAGSLDHANLVEALDAGEHDGVVYLVMKLVEGTDLAKLVRQRGPLPLAEACDLARQTALGLQYLHDRGMVHRDLKPSNLMRLPDGTVKVLDLGLARWRAEAQGSEDLTGPGQVMGTPDYLAPEQVRSAATVDIRADLYGLGGTLYFLLTGQAPFGHRQGLYEKLAAHESEKPRDVRELRPDVPADVADLIARLLAKRPEDRPQTPAEVADALGASAPGAPASTLATTATYMPPTPVRKQRRLAWLAASVGAVIGLALLVGYLSSGKSTQDTPPPPAGKTTTESPAVGPLQILSLNVNHFANVDGKFDQPRGLFGKDSFAAQRDDSVTLEAKLSRPAYAYLIAYRPDGTEEVCFPESDSEPPTLTDRPRYPSVSRGVNYGLNEGEGLQVFALVVSSGPLPAYKDWRTARGSSPWNRFAGPPGVVWHDDGTVAEGLSQQGVSRGERGKGQSLAGKTQIVALTDWLRKGANVEAVTAVGFAVTGKAK